MIDTSAKKAPLTGIRVLDFGHYLAGPLVGMLLADQGAEVIKIDPLGGPVFDNSVNEVLCRGKTLLRLDLKDPDNADTVSSLIKSADVLIENFSPDVMARLGLSLNRLKTLNPDLICLSLPGFDGEEPLAKNAKAFEGIISAVTGQYTNIHAVRELFGLNPVYTDLPLASVYAGVHGATSVVLALRERALGNGAAEIKAPLANAALSAMSSIFLDIENQPKRYATPRLPTVQKNIALPLMRRWAKTGERAQGKLLGIARKSYPALMTSYPCQDGELLYVFAIDNEKLVKAALDVLGLREQALKGGMVFADPYTSGDLRNNLSETSNLSRDNQAMLKTLITEVLITAPAAQWEEKLTAAGVPCAIQRSTQDWMQIPELYESGIVTTFDLSENGSLRQPGVQAWLSDTPKVFARPRRAKARQIELPSPPSPNINSTKEARDPGSWLNGVTVLELCSMVAGPVAGRTLAEYGARVIKVETPRPNHGPRMTCWYGVDGNPGKDSVLLDLKTRGGRNAMAKLVAKADILLTNHMPGAMQNLGLSEADAAELNPDILYARIGAYNGPLKGAWENRNGYDPVLQAASGIMLRYGDPSHPELHAIASCVDALTGYSAAFGIALGLYRNTQQKKHRTVNTSLASAATLIQLPFALSSADQASEASGQTAKGTSPFYRLYQTKTGWIFLGAPHAGVANLPKSFRPAGELSTRQLASHIERICARLSCREVLKRFTEARLSAVKVQTVADLSPRLKLRSGINGIRLVRRNIPSLGPVTSVPAIQITSRGQPLKLLEGTQKPGSSTKTVLEEFGLPTQNLLNNGAAAEAISDDYLPS